VTADRLEVFAAGAGGLNVVETVAPERVVWKTTQGG
jgi:hypothetical protein